MVGEKTERKKEILKTGDRNVYFDEFRSRRKAGTGMYRKSQQLCHLIELGRQCYKKEKKN